MFNWLSSVFGGGAAAMPGVVGPPSAAALANVQPGSWGIPPAPPPMPDPQIMFDPTLGKVVPGSLTPGMPKPGTPPVPMPNPMRQPYGGPDMPPMARGTPSAPPAPAAPPGAGMSAPNWSQAMTEQPKPEPGAGMSASNWTQATSPLSELVDREMQAYGGPDQPPLARGSTAGIPILDFLRANTPTYRTGGSF